MRYVLLVALAACGNDPELGSWQPGQFGFEVCWMRRTPIGANVYHDAWDQNHTPHCSDVAGQTITLGVELTTADLAQPNVAIPIVQDPLTADQLAAVVPGLTQSGVTLTLDEVKPEIAGGFAQYQFIGPFCE